MANVKISTINTTQGYQQPVNPNADGVVAAGFFPQNATSNDAAAGVYRDSSGNLTLMDANAGTKTLTQLASGGGAATTVDVFTASGTWTKPSGATVARILMMGGGGGGQAGTVGPASSTRNGGGGGGAGQFLDLTIALSTVTSSVSVAVGAGGTGGSATPSELGTTGGTSTFGTAGDAFYLEAKGGIGGGGTVTTNGLGWLQTIAPLYTATYAMGVPSPSVMSGGVRGANGGTGANAFPGFSGGGGAGGGITAANAASTATVCPACPTTGMLHYSRGQQATASTSGGITGAAGGAGQTTALGLGIDAAVYFGTGGGGGGCNTSGSGGNGGAGAANWGAGGGGGGAGTTSGTYGNGGTGGSGWVVVLSW